MPVLLSYTGLTKASMDYIRRRQENPRRLWPKVVKFAAPPFAPATIMVGIVLVGAVVWLRHYKKRRT